MCYITIRNCLVMSMSNVIKLYSTHRGAAGQRVTVKRESCGCDPNSEIKIILILSQYNTIAKLVTM